MSIDVDNGTQRLIERELAGGRFLDAREGPPAKEQLESMTSQAISSLDRGEGIDGEEFFAELEAEERALRS